MIARWLSKSKPQGVTLQYFSTEINNNNNSNNLINQLDPSATHLALLQINDYQIATDNFQKKKYKISEEYFNRTKNYLLSTNQQQSEKFLYLNLKLAQSCVLGKKLSDAEVYFESALQIAQKLTTNESIIFEYYNKLFLHCLKTNIDKAILLGQNLLSDNTRSSMPIRFQKIFLLNAATALLLKGRYVLAKNTFRECLIMQSNNDLNGYALNNLGVCSWWHKYPNFNPSNPREEETDTESPANLKYTGHIDSDFQNVTQLFKNSIYHLEDLHQSFDLSRKKIMQDLLDLDYLVPLNEKKYSTDESLLLIKGKESGTPLMNLSEFLYNTHENHQNEATFWFKFLLKHCETYNTKNLPRCFITFGLYCATRKEFTKAEKLFRVALDLLDESDSYNRIYCLQVYGEMLLKIPGRSNEGDKLLSEAYFLDDNFPYWSNKLIHILIPSIQYDQTNFFF